MHVLIGRKFEFLVTRHLKFESLIKMAERIDIEEINPDLFKYAFAFSKFGLS